MKKVFVTIGACFMVILAITLTGCENRNKDEEIKQAVSTVVDFLETAQDSGVYSSVSEYSDGSIYKYYTEDGKIKVEYNEVFYGVKVGSSLYKISQTDDMVWHKTNDTADLSDPISRINNLINGINNISKLSLWTDYDSKTKTLTATYSDGSSTIKLDAGEFMITFISNYGITKHIIKEVGNTTVTLPEDIIDDTPK